MIKLMKNNINYNNDNPVISNIDISESKLSIHYKGSTPQPQPPQTEKISAAWCGIVKLLSIVDNKNSLYGDWSVFSDGIQIPQYPDNGALLPKDKQLSPKKTPPLNTLIAFTVSPDFTEKINCQKESTDPVCLFSLNNKDKPKIKNIWLSVGGGDITWKKTDFSSSTVGSWIDFCKKNFYNGIHIDIEAGFCQWSTDNCVNADDIEGALKQIKQSDLITSITLAYKPGFGSSTDTFIKLNWENCDYIFPQLYSAPGYWNDTGAPSVALSSQVYANAWYYQKDFPDPPCDNVFINAKFCNSSGMNKCEPYDITPNCTSKDNCKYNTGNGPKWEDKLIQGVPIIDNSPAKENCSTPQLYPDFSDPNSKSYIPSKAGYCYWVIGGDWANTPLA